jgi:hypothetical protein
MNNNLGPGCERERQHHAASGGENIPFHHHAPCFNFRTAPLKSRAQRIRRTRFHWGLSSAHDIFASHQALSLRGVACDDSNFEKVFPQPRAPEIHSALRDQTLLADSSCYQVNGLFSRVLSVALRVTAPLVEPLQPPTIEAA